MINAAVVRKTFSDSKLLLAVCAAGVIGFTVLFVAITEAFAPELMQFLSSFQFLTRIFEAAFGIPMRGPISMPVMWSIAFTHGVVLAISWSLLISTASRVTVGEIERGTADLLLTLPISRATVYCSTSLVWVLLAALISCCPLIGMGLASRMFKLSEPLLVSAYYSTTANFVCLNLAVAAITMMVSAMLARRGMAVAIAVAIVLLSSVLNFAMPFIESAQWLKYAGLLEYFRPADCVRETDWPWGSMAMLLAIAATSWSVGLWYYRRRDVPVA